MYKDLNTLNAQDKEKGFTIIEVMIVLAIAGLIMVIIFIAVPALQRAYRDAARKNIAALIKSELESYASHNNNYYPFSHGGSVGDSGYWEDFYGRYVQGKLNVKDPSLDIDVINASGDPNRGRPINYGTAPFDNPFIGDVVDNIHKGDLYIVKGAKCDGENVQRSGVTGADSHNYTVIIGLDRDGTDFCIDAG